MSTPEFAIFQNSRTKQSGVWNGKRWAFPPEKDFEFLRTLSTLIRTDPDPAGLVKAIKIENNKPTNWDVEPGFFIPPEELDGLE